MKMSYVTLAIMFIATFTSTSQSTFNPCLYNREDVLECIDHHHSGVVSPGPNQYTVHATRFQLDSNGQLICVKRKEGEIIEDIIDLGAGDVKFLFSPGAEQSPSKNYTNQILVEYNVQCPLGTSPFVDFEAFDLEPKNCPDYRTNELKCQDYVNINFGAFGSIEHCGNILPSLSFVIGTGNFTLKMRSSFSNSYPGFRAFVTCFKHGGRGTPTLDSNSPPITMTTKDMKIIHTLEKSLLKVALNEAQHRRSSVDWPPTSYQENKPGDITDLNVLASSTPPFQLNNKIPLPLSTPQSTGMHTARQRRKRLFTRNVEGVKVRMDRNAMLVAVRNENARNPIVRSTARSYLIIAQRMDPVQLQEVKQQNLVSNV